MPRKDPITGCDVMTTQEFWAAEAKAEGKGRSGGDLQADFFDELGNEEEAERQRLSQPAAALDLIQSGIKHVNDCVEPADRLPEVDAVLSVEHVYLSFSLRHSRTILVAQAQVKDGTTQMVTFESWHDSGSRMDPPDGETDVYFGRPTGKPGKGCCPHPTPAVHDGTRYCESCDCTLDPA